MQMDIDPVAITQQLERILTSPGFSAAPKMQTLLRYLVETTLKGEGDRLKGYTIGLDVFERATSFDPQRDSIVRVQVGRLRKALQDYYTGPGANDPVCMELPRGGYAMHFASKQADAETIASQAAPRHVRHNRPYLIPLIGLASLCVVLLFIGGLGGNSLFSPQNPRAPSIAVAPFVPVADDALSRQVATGIQVALISDLSRFGEMRIAAVDNRAVATPDRFDFMLSGAVQGEGQAVHVTSQLTRLSDGVVVWTDISSATQRDAPGLFALQAEIATGVAARLATPHGIVQQQMRADIEAARDVRWSDYECVLSNYAYSARVSEEAHARVRDCLEDVVKNAPRYALGWVSLDLWRGRAQRLQPRRRAAAI
jgi:adenylate cyclase